MTYWRAVQNWELLAYAATGFTAGAAAGVIVVARWLGRD